jgi:hypothetical protein
MENKVEGQDKVLELPANIWEKFTRKTKKEDGTEAVTVDFKSIVLEQQYKILMCEEHIKKLTEAMGYVAAFIEAEENKTKLILPGDAGIIKPI